VREIDGLSGKLVQLFMILVQRHIKTVKYNSVLLTFCAFLGGKTFLVGNTKMAVCPLVIWQIVGPNLF
jgi:hypothetical protein